MSKESASRHDDIIAARGGACNQFTRGNYVSATAQKRPCPNRLSSAARTAIAAEVITRMYVNGSANLGNTAVEEQVRVDSIAAVVRGKKETALATSPYTAGNVQQGVDGAECSAGAQLRAFVSTLRGTLSCVGRNTQMRRVRTLKTVLPSPQAAANIQLYLDRLRPRRASVYYLSGRE